MQTGVNVSLWKNDLVKRYLSDFFRPHIPSKGELDIYERHLRKIGPGKALLLGATPGIREILHRLCFEVTLCDASREMVHAMNLIAGRPITESEKVLICDWLKIDAREEFDVILGDHAYSNLLFSSWGRLSENLERALKPGGHMLQNFVIKFPKETRIEDIIAERRKNPAAFRDHIERWYHVYKVITTDPRVYDAKTYTSSWGKYDGILVCMLEEGKITKEEFEDLYTGVDLNGGLPPADIVQSHLEKRFNVLACEYSRERKVHSHYRTFFVRKKQPTSSA